MYTGYFASLKNYQNDGLTLVSIAAKAPVWYHGAEYKKLAPKWSFFNEWKNGSHKGDNDYYTKHFKEEVLDKLDPAKVIKELEELAGVSSDKIILLCYEKPDDFCHRHLVADWFNAHYRSEREKDRKPIPFGEIKDYLTGLGYKIENYGDMAFAMNMEASKANERELKEQVKEWRAIYEINNYASDLDGEVQLPNLGIFY